MTVAPRARLHGFTLVELLTVVAIVSVLVGLLLPAVQQARESSRRLQCRQNLRQMGLALHNYHDLQRVFPRGCFQGRGIGSAAETGWQGFSIHAMLLPMVEQSNLFQAIDFNGYSLTGSPNATLKNTTISTFLCPSDSKNGNTTRGGNNYVASGGPSLIMLTPVPGKELWGTPGISIAESEQIGMFNIRKNISMRHIADGTSNVIAMSEATIGDGENNNYQLGDLAIGGVFPASFPNTYASAAQLELFSGSCTAVSSKHYGQTHVEWINGMPGQTLFNTLNSPNSRSPDCHECTTCGWYDSRGVWSARSRHSGGVNVLLADGSVRFVSENVDLTTWQRLGAIADGNSITLE